MPNSLPDTNTTAEVSFSAPRWIRATLRLVTVTLLILAATADAAILHIRGRLRTSAQGARWMQRWCRRILACMGVQASVSGPMPGATAASGERFEAIVCNHLSYLDILVIASALPCIMVAKREVSGWPVIGWLTTRAGSVYVWRGGRRDTYSAVNTAMARAFRSGMPVVFFPEGTTTNGAEILPFRRGLFHSVLRDQVAVQSAVIQFEAAEPGAKVEEDVCWCGDAALIPHLFRLLGLRGVRARLQFGRTAEGADRFTLSEDARTAVSDLYKLC